MTQLTLASVLLLLASLSACTRPPEPAAVAAASPASAPAAISAPVPNAVVPDRWLGRWTGPEGTFLDIARSADAYRVTVHNLDGPRSFDAGASSADALSFTRDGVTETIRAGNGAATGMKWLADKRDCLVVKAGEGYCRG